jgi:hypothetical protein
LVIGNVSCVSGLDTRGNGTSDGLSFGRRGSTFVRPLPSTFHARLPYTAAPLIFRNAPKSRQAFVPRQR